MRRTGSLSYVFEEKPRNYKAAHGEAVAMPRTRPERLGAFSDGVFAVIITIMVLDLEAAIGGDTCGSPAPVARCIELCGQLSVP